MPIDMYEQLKSTTGLRIKNKVCKQGCMINIQCMLLCRGSFAKLLPYLFAISRSINRFVWPYAVTS